LAKLFMDAALATPKPATSSSPCGAVFLMQEPPFLMQEPPNHRDEGYLCDRFYQQALLCGFATYGGRVQAAD
jgi:hypothetical protein